MYVVYKWKRGETADIVGICLTESGAIRAIKHFKNEYTARHPERKVEMGYDKVLPYLAVKATTFVFKV